MLYFFLLIRTRKNTGDNFNYFPLNSLALESYRCATFCQSNEIKAGKDRLCKNDSSLYIGVNEVTKAAFRDQFGTAYELFELSTFCTC